MTYNKSCFNYNDLQTFIESDSHRSDDSVDMKKSPQVQSDVKVEYSNNTVDDWQHDMILPPRYPPHSDYDELGYPIKVSCQLSTCAVSPAEMPRCVCSSLCCLGLLVVQSVILHVSLILVSISGLIACDYHRVCIFYFIDVCNSFLHIS